MLREELAGWAALATWPGRAPVVPGVAFLEGAAGAAAFFMLGAAETLDALVAGVAVRPASIVVAGADETASARSPCSRDAARACVLRDSVPEGVAAGFAADFTAAPAARDCCAPTRGALAMAVDFAALLAFAALATLAAGARGAT